MQPDYSQFAPLLTTVLVLFVVYRRLRRSFGRQPLQPVRMGLRIGILLLIGALLAPGSLHSPAFLGATLGGIGIGAAMASWGAARTRFERTATRLYYIPHTITGIAISMLFLARLSYRLLQLYAGRGDTLSDQGQSLNSLVSSPLTRGLFYVLMGYYVLYYSLLLRKARHIAPEDIEPRETLHAPGSGTPQ
jgi:hypothetical protein